MHECGDFECGEVQLPDRREHRVYLTEKGRTWYDELCERQRAETVVREPMTTQADVDRIRRLLST